MTEATADIERDLAATRARMDSRLDELQDKMSPTQLVNDAMSYLQGGDGADFTANLVARAKANPWPVVLVGVGIAWLMTSGHSRSPEAPHRAVDDLHARIGDTERGVVRLDDEDEETFGGRLDDARGKVLGISRDASDTHGSYGQRIKDALATAKQTVRESVHDASGRARHAMAGIGDRAAHGTMAMHENAAGLSSSARRTLSGLTGNPLALGAVAAVVGLVAGSVLPTLDGEQAALGSVAGKLKSAGSDLAQDIVDRGGRMANDTLAAVKGSAEAHGLTSGKSVGDVVQGLRSGDLIAEVKQVASETLQAGRDSAQTHLSSQPDTAPPAA
jgi:hypothetical protein